jgi:hypothetical protein
MKKILILAFLFLTAHSAFAETPLQTALTQSASPPSPQDFGKNVIFSCRYTWNDQPIANASVYVNIDGVPFETEYSPTGDYTFSTTTTAVGTHLWYCNAAPSNQFLGDYEGELRTTDGHVDSVSMTNKLIEGHMNFYNYLILYGENDWDDLPGFLEETNGKGISVIVDVVPPWEYPPASEPFESNFTRWGIELATLSLRYPHLIGYTIDDWNLGDEPLSSLPNNPRSIAYGIDSGRDAAKAINPNFKFYPTAYYNCNEGMDPVHPVDGVLLYPDNHWYAQDFPDIDAWKSAISSCKSLFQSDTIIGIYASADPRYNVTPQVLKAKLQISHDENPRGVMTYAPNWSGEMWDTATALYKQWNPYYQPQIGAPESYIIDTAQTTLTQTATPHSQQSYGAAVNFSATYTYADGTSIPRSSVKLYLDGTPIPINPLAALKGGPDGYLYIPDASKIDPTGYTTISSLKIDLWCNMSDTDCQILNGKSLCGCNRTWCDVAGGTSPYSTIKSWPDGRSDARDTALIAAQFGSREGYTAPPYAVNWSYAADCRVDGNAGRKIDAMDVSLASSHFGAKGGTYSSDTTNIRVKFNNNPGYFTPDANGYIQIPAGALNFIVYNGAKPVMALATFWKDYSYITNKLSAGTHTWYFTASKQGYQSQTGPTQYYTITSGAQSLGHVAAEIPQTPTLQWQVAVWTILLLGVGVLVYISLRCIARESVGKKKRK